ncbi:MAG: hypothetical protein ACD_75C00343G0001 [uncultured bacterium]|nr:MAG: hypothetical protein ACD_75C00343G0001 [uncultured bacterium]
MALLTTTPASEMTPTPVMMMPKGDRNMAIPRNAPPRERITEVMMMKGRLTELNIATRVRKMRSRATRKALVRKSWDSFCSSCSPVNFMV